MADIHIKRIATPNQTLGLLRVGGWTCYTLELPWRQNKLRESCIPPEPGHTSVTYEAEKVESPSFGHTIYLPNVSTRSEVLIHPGNYLSDTAGCILVGGDFWDVDGDGLMDVAHSQATMNQLLERVPEEMTISIGWYDRAETAELIALADIELADLGLPEVHA